MAVLIDHAFDILRGEPTIDDGQRADLWDLFNQSANATDLASKLAPLALHPDLKAQLISAKNKPQAEFDGLDRAVQAIHAMAQMNPRVLELAETHPHITKHLVDFATRAEE